MGKRCASSHSMTCGPISASANSRTVARSSSCSSVRRKSMRLECIRKGKRLRPERGVRNVDAVTRYARDMPMYPRQLFTSGCKTRVRRGSCPRTAPLGARAEKHLSRETALRAKRGGPVRGHPRSGFATAYSGFRSALFLFLASILPSTASADVTAFLGSTPTPSTRLVKGFAAGMGLLIAGFEFEYATTNEDPLKTAPGLRTYMFNG